jgi:1,4-dihydroxy-6-naphthoate synthase
MRIKIGYSPCPNDTYIFGALIHGLIDTKGIVFEPYLADVQELNDLASEKFLDVTKLSFYAYCKYESLYNLLDAGSALGRGVGPLLIVNKNSSFKPFQSLPMNAKVALPGKETTAHFLFDYFQTIPVLKDFMAFNEIEGSVLNQTFDAGVIIHENRFTYSERGLVKIIDLGEFWESHTGYPIPLGGIVAKKELGVEMAKIISDLIKESILFAKANPNKIWDYIKENAQEMDDSVIHQHIGLYVNDYSLELGVQGHLAIAKMKELVHLNQMQ